MLMWKVEGELLDLPLLADKIDLIMEQVDRDFARNAGVYSSYEEEEWDYEEAA